MMPWQKVNMYPGIHTISRKNHLARNLMRMAKCFPDEYDFFPKTWILPADGINIRNHCAHAKGKNKPCTYIVKPDSMAQGKGIFLSRDIDKIMKVCANQADNAAFSQHPKEDGTYSDEKIGYVVQ
jgi:tubulin polyglutamylase TTLL6/13